MKRRSFLVASVMVAPALRQAMAQQPSPKKRLAVIVTGKLEDARIGRDPNATVFLEELQRLGYAEDANLIVERWQYQSGRLDEIARQVVDTKPDVIACGGTPITLSLKATTTTIPIVTITGDPIRFGLISNLARPGGNVTGVSVDAGVEVWAKRLELLASAVPKLVNVVFISSPGTWASAGGQAVRDAALKLGISVMASSVISPYGEAEYRSAFSSMQRDQLDGLMFSDEGHLHLPKKALLIELVQQMRLPAIYPYRDFAELGGLMAYASDFKSVIRSQVAQIAQILRGANPGDIPYIQAARFELVFNLKTAKELGIEIPDGLIAAATDVID